MTSSPSSPRTSPRSIVHVSVCLCRTSAGAARGIAKMRRSRSSSSSTLMPSDRNHYQKKSSGQSTVDCPLSSADSRVHGTDHTPDISDRSTERAPLRGYVRREAAAKDGTVRYGMGLGGRKATDDDEVRSGRDGCGEMRGQREGKWKWNGEGLRWPVARGPRRG